MSFYPRAEQRNRFCARCFWHIEFVKNGLARCVMPSVRQVADRFDEFKRNGFEDRQARVLAIAIDETVEDRHAGFLAHIDKRFDEVDKKFDEARKELAERFDWFVYKVAVVTTAFLAGSMAAFIGGYQIVKLLIG